MELERIHQRPVTFQEGAKLAKDLGAAAFVECSAMKVCTWLYDMHVLMCVQGSRVHEVFETALRTLMEKKGPKPHKRQMCIVM